MMRCSSSHLTCHPFCVGELLGAHIARADEVASRPSSSTELQNPRRPHLPVGAAPQPVAEATHFIVEKNHVALVRGQHELGDGVFGQLHDVLFFLFRWLRGITGETSRCPPMAFSGTVTNRE